MFCPSLCICTSNFLSQPALQLTYNYILRNYPKTNENLTFDPPYSNRDCGEFGCYVPNLDDIVRVTLNIVEGHKYNFIFVLPSFGKRLVLNLNNIESPS